MPPVARTQRGNCLGDVGVDRADRQSGDDGDFLGCLSLKHQPKALALPRGQSLDQNARID